MLIVSHHNKIAWSYYKTIGSIIFGISIIVIFALSSTYHALGLVDEVYKSRMQAMDHIAIYFVIAGTYTPIILTLIIEKGKHYKLGICVLIMEWVAVIGGIYMKSNYVIDELPKLISNGYYLLMGWGIIIVFKPAIRLTPYIVKKWVLIGGLCYSFGVIFLIWEQLHFNHCIWHMFVIMGAFSHYLTVMFCITEKDSVEELFTFIYETLGYQKTKAM